MNNSRKTYLNRFSDDLQSRNIKSLSVSVIAISFKSLDEYGKNKKVCIKFFIGENFIKMKRTIKDNAFKAYSLSIK